MELKKIGFGGGCHWCTEAVFDSLIGVRKVVQGWISSNPPNDTFSEAVIVHFIESEISLEVLIEIHLMTHASTADHSMRQKYRSAIYFFEEKQQLTSKKTLPLLSKHFEKPIITSILPFRSFKASSEKYQDYYLKNSDKPFCQTFINPKLAMLRKQYLDQVKVH